MRRSPPLPSLRLLLPSRCPTVPVLPPPLLSTPSSATLIDRGRRGLLSPPSLPPLLSFTLAQQKPTRLSASRSIYPLPPLLPLSPLPPSHPFPPLPPPPTPPSCRPSHEAARLAVLCNLSTLPQLPLCHLSPSSLTMYGLMSWQWTSECKLSRLSSLLSYPPSLLCRRSHSRPSLSSLPPHGGLSTMSLHLLPLLTSLYFSPVILRPPPIAFPSYLRWVETSPSPVLTFRLLLACVDW